MAHPFDLGQLMNDVTAAVSDVLQKDVTTISGFSRNQLQLLAKQSAWIAEATANNELTDDLRDFFLGNLADMALNFVKVLRGLALIAVEKAWNAVVGVLWKAIGGAAGVALPLPAGMIT